MPTVDVGENIKQLNLQIQNMTNEIYQLQGMLKTFEGFKQGGLKTIELPSDPNQEPDDAIKRDELVDIIENVISE
tara:strand:- start:695 stop:919 length:225 start_codon:yes stop_codon:yes gene_type:complete